MRNRSLKSRLVATAGATLATCLIGLGQEARSALRPLFAGSSEGPRPYREGHPFHIRIHADDGKFTEKTKVVHVKYTDETKGVPAVEWAVLGVKPDKHSHCLRVLVKPELPKPAKANCDDCSQAVASATGTGTILVTTTNPDTTSTTPIPVSLIDSPDGP